MATNEKPTPTESKTPNRSSYKIKEKDFKLIAKGYVTTTVEHKGVYVRLRAYDLSSEVSGVVKNLIGSLNAMGEVADKTIDTLLNPTASGLISGAIAFSEGTANTTMDAAAGMYNIATSGQAGAIIMEGASKGIEYIKQKTIESAKVAEKGILRAAKSHASWLLPLPSQLSSNLAHNYTEDEMDPIDKLQGIKSFQALKIAGGKFQKIADGAVGSMREGIKMAKRSNATIDTNVLSIFTGTNCRQFTFDFTLIATTEKHANEIVSAILALKVNIAGYRDSSQLVIVQDNVFSIEFIDEEGRRVNYIQELLMLNKEIDLNLTDINITYGADGAMTLFRNGLPKVITLSLSFTERKPAYLNPTINKDTGKQTK